MKSLAWNIVLAFVWVALTGDLTPRGLFVGLLLGYVIIAVVGPAVGVRGYGSRVLHVIGFFFFYLWDLTLSNLRVARDVVRPRSHSRPAFVAIPVAGLTDRQITLLANLISMTPGTLSIDVSGDQNTLYVHAMFVDDPDRLRASIERGLVRRVREVIE